ncbi:hypothetical protein F5Y02DRAFT_372386 [Annulohypoxylon stygium]|nr:hypothetical protein F5Y02DRAFT_372386 [Annulohypoxylon stygium]
MKLLKVIILIGAIASSKAAKNSVGQYDPLGSVYDIPRNHHCSSQEYESSDDYTETLINLATYCSHKTIPKGSVRYSRAGDVLVCAYNRDGNGNCSFEDIMDAKAYLDTVCGLRKSGYIHLEVADMIYGRGTSYTGVCNLAVSSSSQHLLLGS